MQTLIALLVAALAASAIARPPGPTAAAPASLLGQEVQRMPPRPPAPPQEFLGDYLLPRMLLPHYVGYVESPVIAPQISDNDWLSQEIERINQMSEEEELMNPYDPDLLRWYPQDAYLQNTLENPVGLQEPVYSPDIIQDIIEDMKPMPVFEPRTLLRNGKPRPEMKRGQTDLISDHKDISSDVRKEFALTPLDQGYFEPILEQHQQSPIKILKPEEEGLEPRAAMVLEPPRQTRQNPNLSKQKNLLEPDLEKLKTGLTHKEYRLPVSLLPADLRWLKVNQPENVDHYDDDDGHHLERSHEEGAMGGVGGVSGVSGMGAAGKQHQVRVMEDPAESIFGVALVAAVGAALAMAIVGFAFGWYTLSKRAKAAADVDYPAYGVTGPSVDSSGDRKLAQSAHMYHYQHQKQQIIAMERNGLEQRNGSVSDPESEEENEEGDYTVYECPGFATTGDMEVKNPLFSEDPTPVTPGKCEVVKQQPKD